AGDGRDGLAAMTLHRLGVHAAKAWFFQGDTVVCLGAGIRADDQAAPLVTTLEQCWARGDVTRGDGWARHNGVTYHQLGDGTFRAETTPRNGSWRTMDRLQGSTRKVEGEIFTAWIEHGATPATYAYLVEVSNGGAAPRVLVNTENIQAVASAASELVQIVFRKPASLTLPDKLRIDADQPCLVQLRRPIGAASWSLSVGNPAHRVGDVQITLTIASDTKTITFAFPDSPFAGQPQTRTLAFP
ncbi:MAG: hypothetical protein H7067_07195, partial [Burkholderiales bacterium]|nr:hypothetical protein [Opitutaceae bacterium]